MECVISMVSRSTSVSLKTVISELNYVLLEAICSKFAYRSLLIRDSTEGGTLCKIVLINT